MNEEKFTTAIKKGLEYVNNTNTEDLVKYLTPSFTSSSKEEIISVINNYKSIGAWPNKLGFTKENFEKLVEIVKEAGELDKEIEVPYDKLVTSKIIEHSKNGSIN